jgi:hypothetical protein
MRQIFSADVLKILPPATNFGEAWENLCLRLLQADTSDNSIMRLGPPDQGIDIYRQSTRAAYQCKSSERGTFGTIDAKDCIASLATAIAAQKSIPWVHYSVALNAPLSGIGLSKINEFATSQALPTASLSILPPEYWSELCERHAEAIKHLFDHRFTLTEAQVIEAMKKAQYYDSFIHQAVEHTRTAPLNVVVSNNRTPVELVIPFSGELTVGQLYHVVKSHLGLSTDWANFPDLGTSSGPSLSMTVDRVPQSFKLKLSELTAEQRSKLQLWIRLSWQDDLQSDEDRDKANKVFLQDFSRIIIHRPETKEARGRITLDRMDSIIQNTIWQSLSGRATSKSG